MSGGRAARLLLVAAAICGTSGGAAGCGMHSSPTPSDRAAHTAAPSEQGRPVMPYRLSRRGYVIGDGDDDAYNPRDDVSVRRYGHRAPRAVRRAVISAVKRYFQAAAKGDGASACALLSSSLARQSDDLSRAVPADYASPQTAALRGEQCARFMTRLFELSRQQLAAARPSTLAVTSVRLQGAVALAVLAFRTAPERAIPLRRERAAWKMAALLDLPIP